MGGSRIAELTKPLEQRCLEMGSDAIGQLLQVTLQERAFGLAEGDRVIVNPELELSREGRLYALRAPGGVAVARLLPSLAAATDDVNLNGSYGETRSCKRSALTVLGVIVGMIRAS